MKIRSTALASIVAAALLATVILNPAMAASDPDKENERGPAFTDSQKFGPIGTLTVSSLNTSVVIDGRLAQREEKIWGGELIHSSGERGTRIEVSSTGQIIVDRDSWVRVSKAQSSDEASCLVISLISGALRVSLAADARAFVQAGVSSITASAGASFNVRVADNHASVETISGITHLQDSAAPQEVNIRMVDDTGRAVSAGSRLSVRARSTRQIQVQVTDKNDKPLPDLPVLFSLGSPCLGSLGIGVAAGGTFTQKTDKRGIASVPLITGAAKCAASILAKVEGTNASVSIQTNVLQPRGFWSTQNTLLVVAAAAAAAGVGIGLAVTNSGSEPIRAVPPPKVTP